MAIGYFEDPAAEQLFKRVGGTTRFFIVKMGK